MKSRVLIRDGKLYRSVPEISCQGCAFEHGCIIPHCVRGDALIIWKEVTPEEVEKFRLRKVYFNKALHNRQLYEGKLT